MSELVSFYSVSCAHAGVRASWHDVITAIGLLYAEQKLQALPDYSWQLDPEVWEAALEHAITNAGPTTAEA
jgi:hypothetical protein